MENAPLLLVTEKHRKDGEERDQILFDLLKVAKASKPRLGGGGGTVWTKDQHDTSQRSSMQNFLKGRKEGKKEESRDQQI